MKKLYTLVTAVLLICGMSSCKDDEQASIIPAEITNLQADTQNKPGYIVLRWDTPEDPATAATIKFIQVDYYDHLLKKKVMRVASVYADSVLIPETRKKYGDYEFMVQTVSESGDRGTSQMIKATSEAAAVKVVFGADAKIELTAAQLSTNAQEPGGDLTANLLDDNAKTFFHSKWNDPDATTDGSPQHWFQVDLGAGKEIGYFKYESQARNNNNIPSDVDILGSNDGVKFTLIANLTKEKDGMLMNTTAYRTQVLGSYDKTYRYIRYLVKKTNSGPKFFSMAEFKLFTVEASVVDPELPD